jgi:uncharacterized protein involved in tolerance to divalent cations
MLFGKQVKRIDFMIACLLFVAACLSLYQWQSTTRLADQVAAKQQKLDEIKVIASAVKSLPNYSTPTSTELTLAEVQRVMNRQALKPETMDFKNNGRIHIRFEEIGFNQLLRILPMLQRAFILVEKLEIAKTENSGFVSVELVLTRLAE